MSNNFTVDDLPTLRKLERIGAKMQDPAYGSFLAGFCRELANEIEE